MRVSHQHRTLFIQFQKTGATTLSRMLKRLNDNEALTPKHADLTAALRRYPELESYCTFGFVRNPWDRADSSTGVR